MPPEIGFAICAILLLVALLLRIVAANIRKSGAPLAMAYENATRRLSNAALLAAGICGILTLLLVTLNE